MAVFQSKTRLYQCLLVLLAGGVVCLNGLRRAWETHRTVEISRRKASRLPMETLLKEFPKATKRPTNRPLSGPRKFPKFHKTLVL